jgi:hypothetical protein
VTIKPVELDRYNDLLAIKQDFQVESIKSERLRVEVRRRKLDGCDQRLDRDDNKIKSTPFRSDDPRQVLRLPGW